MDDRAGIEVSSHAPSIDWSGLDGPAHVAQFYQDDGFVVDQAARFLGESLRRGGPAIAIAAREHLEPLDESFRAQGIDPELARAEGRYVSLDAAGTLAQFMVGDSPDAARFAKVIGDIIVRVASSAAAPLRVFGEMVTLLWVDGNEEAAVRLEALWNDMAESLPFALVCAYPIEASNRSDGDDHFAEVCSAHSHVLPAESYWNAGPAGDRLRAVTELQRKLSALELEHADGDRARNELLAMLGHELRNPLAAVRSALEIARIDERHRSEAFEIAGRQAAHLGRLVDDLLDVARITQNRITLQREPIPFRLVVERAIASTRSCLEERQHEVEVSLPPGDVRVDVDPVRIEQVIVNLLANAGQFTEPGGRIEVWAGRDGDRAVLRVRDSGVGISPDLLPRIFDPFTQANQSLARSAGGLGVGLTIVKRLVELHDGRVEARSDGSGKGSELLVSLPALSASPVVASGAHPSGEPAPGVARVLLVEDNPDVAKSLRMILEISGHQVSVVGDGLAALEAVRSEIPDLMIVDIGLPGIDGYEVARRVRGDSTLASVALVALSGYGAPDDGKRALAAGFDHYLVKPVDIGTFQRLVSGFSRSSNRD